SFVAPHRSSVQTAPRHRRSLCRLRRRNLRSLGSPLVTSVPGYLSSLFSLDGRLALVTGGSSGIGEGIAVALAGAGARVVLLARDKARLEAAAARTGAAGWVSADAADRAALTAAAGEVTARFGEPDILVNAAAVNLRPPLDELTD